MSQVTYDLYVCERPVVFTDTGEEASCLMYYSFILKR